MSLQDRLNNTPPVAAAVDAGQLDMLVEALAGGDVKQDRSALRRCLVDAVRQWPGPLPQRWWKWSLEAGTSSLQRATVVDCTSDQIVDLLSSGHRVLVGWSREESFRVSAITREGNRFTVEGRAERMTAAGLKRFLREHAMDGVVRCVAIGEGELLSSPEKSKKPLARLRQLLAPEAGDIWIVLLFAVVVGVLSLAVPIAVEALVNTVAFGRFLQPVIVLALLLFTFLLFSAALVGLQTIVVEIIQRRLLARIAGELAWRLPRVRHEVSDQQYVPELVNRFFDVVTVQKVSAQFLLDGIALVLSTVVGMVVLAFYHPFLLGYDIALLALLVFVTLLLGRGAVASSIKESKSKYALAAWLEDVARCPLTFGTTAGIQLCVDRTNQLTGQYLAYRRAHFLILIRQIFFALALQAIASTVLLGLGGWLVISGQLTLGQLVAAELIVTVIVGSFAKLGKHIDSFYDLMASVDKLGALFDLPTERQGGMLHFDTGAATEVELCDVRCGRLPGPKTNVSCRIEAGERVALCGESGSGKSEILDLLCGLRSPAAGTVTIDGHEPRDLRPDVLRNHVVLTRSVEVFDGTVAENVHLGRGDVASEDVKQALKCVGLYEAVLRMEKGLETRLTSGGAPLSENQLRLLMLARALVTRPRLWAIDGLLDALSKERLENLLPMLAALPITIIVVTGRRSIAAWCDRVIQLSPDNSRTESLSGASP
jgi:ABC-type bacteriocin/lantibiotic exporter with double-glycine peptidase domain